MTQYQSKTTAEIISAEKSSKGYTFAGHEFPVGSYIIYEGGAVSKVLFAEYFTENYKEIKEETPKAPKV